MAFWQYLKNRVREPSTIQAIGVLLAVAGPLLFGVEGWGQIMVALGLTGVGAGVLMPERGAPPK